MQTFDASSMIHAWDHYPPAQFPALWRWLAEQVAAGVFTIPRVAFEEVENKQPDCASWLVNANIRKLAVTNEIAQAALGIKGLLGVEVDRYHVNGVCENDVLIIATAAVEVHELISNEGQQLSLPKDLRKYKIPAVCAMEAVGVPCIDFLALIRRSGEVFGE